MLNGKGRLFDPSSGQFRLFFFFFDFFLGVSSLRDIRLAKSIYLGTRSATKTSPIGNGRKVGNDRKESRNAGKARD